MVDRLIWPSTRDIGHWRSASPPRYTPAMGEMLRTSLHGHEVAYRDEGQGDAILLVHGMAGSSRTWREVLPSLAEHHRVVAPDLVGHGRSEKPAGDYSLGAFANLLRDLLDTLGIEHATVVGQSLGGGIAMQFAYQFPERVDRLVLVSSGGLGREVSWMLRLLAAPGAELALPLIAPWFVRDPGTATSRWLRDRGVRVARLAEMWDAYSSLTDAETRAAFLRTLRAVVDPGGQTIDASDRLHLAASTPTLIIWGDADAIIPVQHATDAHAALPGSRLEIFEGVGHFPQAEDPARFLAVLEDFLGTTAPLRRTA
jgi:pimeloyl-ACP methyl ester carboxylesterase